MHPSSSSSSDLTKSAPKLRLVAEVAAVLALFAASLALLPLHRVLAGGVLAHSAIILRMLFFVAVCTVLLRNTGQSWREVGLRAPRSWGRVALLVVLAYIGLMMLQVLIALLLKATGWTAGDVAPFRVLQGDLARYLFFAIPVSLGAAAFGEEMLLRGYLLNRLAVIFGNEAGARWILAAIVQGLLFGLAHAYQGIGGMVVVAFVGIIFGALYLLNGRNLWACIILHGVIDFVAMTMFYLGLVPGG